MRNITRVPTWLIGGTIIWLAFVLGLSFLHLSLLSQWNVPFTLQLYTLSSDQTVSLAHILLLGMVAPGFFTLDAFSFLHIHIPWLDAAIYNWRTLVLISSIPVFITGALAFSKDRRLTLVGTILGLALLGGSLLFILNHLLAR